MPTHSHIDVIRRILERRDPATNDQLREHLAWAVLMLDSAEDLFEADVLQHEKRCRWLELLDNTWHQEPQWQGPLPEWHQQRADGPRLRPEE